MDLSRDRPYRARGHTRKTTRHGHIFGARETLARPDRRRREKELATEKKYSQRDAEWAAGMAKEVLPRLGGAKREVEPAQAESKAESMEA